MSEEVVKVALVIPVHNRRDTTMRCLRSLNRIDAIGLEVKIFVVDDGSTDGTSAAIRSHFPEVVLIAGDGSLHYAGGTNRGIERSLEWNPDYIVTMNDDAVYHADFLKRLVETASREHRSIVGSLLLLWDEPHRVFQVDLKWNTFAAGWVVPEDLTVFTVAPDPFEVECIVGNCVLFPVAAIRENGLMDERRFAHGWGDVQYTMRMRKAGWKLLVDTRSFVWCEPNTYPPALHTQPKSQVIRDLLVNKRHPSNLGRQFTALWHSAPSKHQALCAFGIYCLRLALKAAGIIRFADRRTAAAG